MGELTGLQALHFANKKAQEAVTAHVLSLPQHAEQDPREGADQLVVRGLHAVPKTNPHHWR